MSDFRVVLPGREEMLRRLTSVDKDRDAVDNFYPLLLQTAGQSLFPEQIVMELANAIVGYAKGKPPIFEYCILKMAPRYLEALIDNPLFAKRAKILLDKVLSRPE